MNQTAIAKQLDDWQALPKPQRLSEFYFDPTTSLPASAKPSTSQRLAFIIHNIEHRTTQYHYKLLAVSAEGNIIQSLGADTLTLDHDQTQTVTLTIPMPSIEDRVAIKVELEYEAMKSNGTHELQKQSIHYWVQITESRP